MQKIHIILYPTLSYSATAYLRLNLNLLFR